MKTEQTFADKLRANRALKLLSQTVAGERLGIPTRTLQEWEQGRRTPPDYTQQSVLERLENLTEENSKEKELAAPAVLR